MVVNVIQRFIFSITVQSVILAAWTRGQWELFLFSHLIWCHWWGKFTLRYNKKKWWFFSPRQYNVIMHSNSCYCFSLDISQQLHASFPKWLKAGVNILPFVWQRAVTSHWTNLPKQLAQLRELKTTPFSSPESSLFPKRILIFAFSFSTTGLFTPTKIDKELEFS